MKTAASVKSLGGALALSALLFAVPASTQQVTFTIDLGGPTISLPDCSFAVPITEGDILTVCTPTASPMAGFVGTPSMVLSGGFGPPALGLGIGTHPGAIGHPPGAWGLVEVDALSYGLDGYLDQIDYSHGKLIFSVDNFAFGFPGSPLPPNVATEGPVFDQAADMFRSLDLTLSAFPLPPLPLGSSGFYDGDGILSASGFTYPNLGLFEPTAPGPPGGAGGLPGDNIDGFDSEVSLPSYFPFYPPGGILFSLDAHFPDPITGVQNSGSAMANLFRGADVLWATIPGGPIAVYAPATALGLDLIGGSGSDDLDALSVWENGLFGWQQSMAPFDWVGGGTDMLLFSVRRGSAVIGQPDSLRGMPIEAGDILTTPAVPGGLPAVLIPAEVLGLWTVRSNGPGAFGPFGDDLDALDILNVHDPVTPDCMGDVVACPCGNNSQPGTQEGCIHSGLVGMKLQGAPGSGSSLSTQDLNVLVTQVPVGGNSGLFLLNNNNMGAGPFFDGYNCVAGGPRLLPGAADAAGNRLSGDVIGASNMVAPGFLAAGSSYWIQYWSRDVLCGPPPAACMTPCGTNANFSNAGMFTLTP